MPPKEGKANSQPPSKATGKELTIWVYLEGVAKQLDVRIVDTEYVSTPWRAIIAAFPAQLGGRSASNLRVWVPNATFEQSDPTAPLVWTPNSSDDAEELMNAQARLADVLRRDQPGQNGKLSVYVTKLPPLAKEGVPNMAVLLSMMKLQLAKEGVSMELPLGKEGVSSMADLLSMVKAKEGVSSVADLLSMVKLSIPDVRLEYVSPRDYCHKSFLCEEANVPLLCVGDQKFVDFRFLNVEFKDIREQIDATLKSSNIAALVRVSGCGKTSSGFNFASSNFSLYFEAYGSPDFSRVSDSIRSTLFALDQEQRLGKAVLLWTCFFAARAAYLIKLLRSNPNITPQQWLLMQLPLPKSIAKPEKHLAMFRVCHELFEQLASSRKAPWLCDEIFASLRQLSPVFIFIDEAQTLLEIHPALVRPPEVHANKKQRREPDHMLLSIIVKSIVQLHFPLVLAGTKLGLVKDWGNVARGVSKLGIAEVDPEVKPITDFPFFEQKVVQQKIGEFVSFGDNCLTLDLSGRARFWASFAYVLLMRASSHNDLASLLESCSRDFSAFHLFGLASSPPLHQPTRSIRAHFERHLRENPASPNQAKNLYSELATLVTASWLGMGDPIRLPSSQDEVDWVAGAICFLHRAAEDGCVLLSCKEPLVLDAITQAIQGQDAIVEEFKSCLERTKKMRLGKEDEATKGIFFQQMTTARLLQQTFRSSTQRPILLSELLVEWGVAASELPAWLTPHLKNPVTLSRVAKDASGESFVDLLTKGSTAVLIQPNDARVEYVGIIGGVLMTAGRKFYSGQNDKANAIVRSNDAWGTSDLSNIYVTDKGEVLGRWQERKTAVDTALKDFFVKSKTEGTIRLHFCLEKDYKCPLVTPHHDTKRFDNTDLIITFTRDNIDTFFKNTKICQMLESFL